MSNFIQTTDYDATIHTEILSAIIRDDAIALELAEDMAIEEMTGYLNSRYDTENMFGKTGKYRNKVVMMIAIDIVLYHLHSAHNPARFPEIRKDRYNRAIEWLKMVRGGEISPSGLILKSNDDGSSGTGDKISFTYKTKRNNQF